MPRSTDSWVSGAQALAALVQASILSLRPRSDWAVDIEPLAFASGGQVLVTAPSPVWLHCLRTLRAELDGEQQPKGQQVGWEGVGKRQLGPYAAVPSLGDACKSPAHFLQPPMTQLPSPAQPRGSLHSHLQDHSTPAGKLKSTWQEAHTADQSRLPARAIHALACSPRRRAGARSASPCQHHELTSARRPAATLAHWAHPADGLLS
jgi:hypothetical protein